MNYGFVLPYGDARTAMELAVEAEQAGWDGFFVWEPVWGIDAWVCLTAAAVKTRSIKLGTLLSPLSRMRPWKVASETATLDNLSGGRLILSVGLGAADTGFRQFGEETDMRVRAELMDEALDIITGLWRGQPFNHEGRHYRITETDFHPPPPPVNERRVPIWIVGLWPNRKSMARVVKYQGLLPSVRNERGEWRKLTPDDVRAMRTWLTERGCDEHYDIVVEGVTPGDDPEKAKVEIESWRAAGATWWIESMWEAQYDRAGHDAVVQRLKRGPPCLD